MHTKEQLTPHAIEALRQVRAALPPHISARLTANRHFVTHGSYRTLSLFDVWDKYQTDALPHQHFKYGLGCDQRAGANHVGYIGLWINRIRIYRQREAILNILDREIPRRVPAAFTLRCHPRAFNVGWNFEYPADLSRLPKLLVPRYVELISAYHPLLMPIIDQFATPLAKGERRAVIVARGRTLFAATKVRFSREAVRDHTRSVPLSWKEPILQEYSYRCADAECQADLRETGWHFDHIQAFSRGGKTSRENLQPLCPACNLRKGHR